MSNASIQTAAVANALSDEKAFRTVYFAITGEPDVDLLSGLVAMIESFDPVPASACELLEYLLKRYNRMAEDAKRQQMRMDNLSQLGGLGGPLPDSGGTMVGSLLDQYRQQEQASKSLYATPDSNP